MDTPLAPGDKRRIEFTTTLQERGFPNRRPLTPIVAGGQLVRTDTLIMNFFPIQSARYAVRRERWQSVDLAIHYHSAHEYNVRRMLDAMKVSFAMSSEKFSPYQFRHARILEFPSYATFAQSFANTIPYAEAIGFIFNYEGDPEKIDLVTCVAAHEIRHRRRARAARRQS